MNIRKGMQFLWEPPTTSGKIVSMIQFQDHILIACEYAIYRMRQKEGDDVVVEEIEMIDA